MTDVRPTPALLPLTPRETAPYFVSIVAFQHAFQEKKATVYVKAGDFFRSQGGLVEEWGTHWTGIHATSLNDARLKAHASEGTACPRWHLEEQDGPPTP
jgi:hypothetical protein